MLTIKLTNFKNKNDCNYIDAYYNNAMQICEERNLVNVFPRSSNGNFNHLIALLCRINEIMNM